MALTDNLISVWHMNNDWQDSIGANHGTATGATFSASAKLGSHAGSFDGADDKVEIANESNFDFERTNAFSLGAWFKSPNLTAGSGYIISKMANSAPYTGWALSLDDTGYLRMEIINDWGAGNYLNEKTVTTGYDDDAWHRVIVTYDGSSTAAGLLIYVDGSAASTTIVQDNLSASILNNVAVHLGSIGGTAVYFKGLLDEGAVWNRAITSAEVTEDWNGGAGIELGAAVLRSYERTLRGVNRGLMRGL